MSKKPWSEIFADSWVPTGTVAKIKMLEKLQRFGSRRFPISQWPVAQLDSQSFNGSEKNAFMRV
jgi:hypothetical protein